MKNLLLVRSVMIVATIFLNSCCSRPSVISNDIDHDEKLFENDIHRLVRRWAPLVLLAPGERFLPSSVPYFLQNAIPADPTNKTIPWTQDLPYGFMSEKYYLFTKKPVEQLLMNTTSFLHGQNPQVSPVPVYAVIKRCTSTKFTSRLTNTFDAPPERNFHVTYWFFYPFNEGKSLCTISLGHLGPLPFPKFFNKCIGVQKFIGNHVGDWEHMSLYFQNSDIPDRMYVSTHDSGVYYKYNSIMNGFVYERQETRRGILQKPKFPTKVYLLHGHPLMYAAKGSHGFWSKPGRHRYVTVPRLHDETGNGIPWKTWDSLEIIDPPYTIVPQWLKFRGRWGNTKSYCHPLKKVGINLCQLSDGPTGIPLKRLNFVCPKSK